MKILIAGLGNVLLRDDGIGVHAVRKIAEDPPPGAVAVEVGTAVLDALHLIEEAERVIAIDAVEAGGAPGTVYSFSIEDAEARSGPVSLHELSLREAMGLLGDRPAPPITIVGVEPEIIDYGMELSPVVEATLPRVVRAVRDMAARQGKGGSS